MERRVSAAKLCRAALYIGIGAAVGYFLAGPFALPVAAAALVLGILGLAKLGAVGPGRPVARCEPGRERLAARMTKSARSQAWVGIAVGGGMIALTAAMYWSALKATRLQPEDVPLFYDGFPEREEPPFEERKER